jgi:hypothetical protein
VVSEKVIMPNENVWSQVEQLALTDPVIYRAVTMVHLGQATMPQALAEAVIALAVANSNLREQLIEHMKLRCPDLSVHTG